jgi:hypothetical protein
MRHIDQATVAGYYGSDSAGTFVTCIGVLATGLTFSYNMTIGIPIYIEIAKIVTKTFPIA